MNMLMANYVHYATRRFMLIGLQHTLLQQSSNALYSGGIKSPNGMSYHSGLSLKMTSRRHGTLHLLDHSLTKVYDNFALPGKVQRNMNILPQNAPFGKLGHKGSYQGMPSCSLLRFEVCTVALDADKNKTEVEDDDEECPPKYLDPYAGPERDVINFPRPFRRICPEKVRHAFVPESWFQSFYKKTGVTGPYALLFTTMTFLISKEIYVLEHEYYSGISVAIICHYCVTNYGHHLAAFLDEKIDECSKDWQMRRKLDEQAYQDGIEDERLSQFQSEGQTTLFEIKKQVVAIQLECEYRKRLWEAYNEVVQQLEKELMKEQVRKCVAHKNMHQWVLNQVIQGITPEVEAAVLKWSLCQIQELACQHQSASFPPALGRDKESSVIVACVSENSGLGISPQGFHVISKKDEKNQFDESQIYTLLLQPPDSEYK